MSYHSSVVVPRTAQKTGILHSTNLPLGTRQHCPGEVDAGMIHVANVWQSSHAGKSSTRSLTHVVTVKRLAELAGRMAGWLVPLVTWSAAMEYILHQLA